MESYIVGVGSWIGCALFAFWLAARAASGREQVGRILVGIGALLIGFALLLPTGGPNALPPWAVLSTMMFAGVSLFGGLILSFPRSGLKSVVEPE